MNTQNIDKLQKILGQILSVKSEIQKKNYNYFQLSYEHLEHQAQIISRIEKETNDLKKEIIKAQINANISNKKIAEFFKVSEARISQLKKEIREKEMLEREKYMISEKHISDFFIYTPQTYKKEKKSEKSNIYYKISDFSKRK